MSVAGFGDCDKDSAEESTTVPKTSSVKRALSGSKCTPEGGGMQVNSPAIAMKHARPS